jgi:hypothetical protein
MGLPMLHACDMERLRAVCEEEGRNDFLLVVSPLALLRASGSPANPLCIF